MSGLVIHVPGDWIDGPNMRPFYRRLAAGLAGRDIPCRFHPMDRAALADEIAADDDFHILNHARHPHPRVLSAGIAYLYPFWHLDPDGIRAFSSIRRQDFVPHHIDPVQAKRIFDRLVRRNVSARKSRYEQPEDIEDIPNGVIAIFLQSEGHRNVDETCYLDRWTMLDTCLAHANGRRVVVKPHPREVSIALFDRLVALQEEHPNLQISLANIHDILARADRVVTINSAVGIEAYLHQKPVILCGQTDFHHITTEATDTMSLAAALEQPAPNVDYARYIAWYFGQNCVDAGSDKMVDQIMAKIRATGYNFPGQP